MKAGKIIRTFLSKDGNRVVLRSLKWEDLDDLLQLINSLVEEEANISRDQPVSWEEEVDWLSRALKRQELGEIVYLAAEVGGKVVANSDMNRKSTVYDKHVGVIGIVVKDGFRDLGIGTEMMKTLIEQAREMSLTVLTLDVFANNPRAIHVYEKVGFIQTGRIPKSFFKEGNYVDKVIMTRVLE